MRVQCEVVTGLHAPDVGRHRERRESTTGRRDRHQSAEIGADALEVEPDLLPGFAAGGLPQARVLDVPSSARQRDVSGPRIALVLRASNQEQVEVGAGAQQKGDGGLELARRRRRRAVRLERALYRA